jgi:diketogulonate reductase-like aldo/keto reductase
MARGVFAERGPDLHPFLVTSSFGPPVCRLGLASYGRTAISPDDVLWAVDWGVNFLNWQGFAEGPSDGDAFSVAISTLGARRESVVGCAQFGARDGEDAATELRSALAARGTDYIDLLTLYYVERLDEWEELTAPGGALRYLWDARQDGTVRRIGITSHQRLLAAKMVESGLLDAVMIRYNAAHRGAERDVFPVMRRLELPVIAYTALRWGAVLRPTPDDPAGFSVPRPPDWYRFVLQHPAVAVTLAAPQTRAELEEDLRVLEAEGPLAEEAYATLAEHGERVRRHAGTFQWPRDRRSKERHGAGVARSALDLDPRRGMIAGLLQRPDVPVDARGLQPRGELRAQEQVVDADAGVPGEGVPEIVPEGVDLLTREHRAQDVCPALGEQPPVSLAGLGEEERVVDPPLRPVGIQLGRDDVVIAREDDRPALVEQACGMAVQSLEPLQLVIELRPRGGVAVKQVEAADRHAAREGLDVAALGVVRVARQAAPDLLGLLAPCEDGDAVPGFLAIPDRLVARVEAGVDGELLVRSPSRAGTSTRSGGVADSASLAPRWRHPLWPPSILARPDWRDPA